MKRLVIEVPYQRFWRLLFGRYAGRVEVVEVLKCLKCDAEGFAIICKIRFLDKRLRTSDLVRSGPIRQLETLYRAHDGSIVIFMSGDNPEILKSRGRPLPTKVFFEGPPEFVDANTMKVALVGADKELQDLMRHARLLRESPKILSLTRLKLQPETPISMLATKQRQALLAAYSLGYYEVPRRVSSKELAKLLRIDKSTLAEHLRKAERKIVRSVLAG